MQETTDALSQNIKLAKNDVSNTLNGKILMKTKLAKNDVSNRLGGKVLMKASQKSMLF